MSTSLSLRVPCVGLSLSSLGEVEGVEPKKVLVLKMLVLRVRNRFNLEGGMSDFDGEMVHRALVQRVNNLVALAGSNRLGNLNMCGNGHQV